MQLQSAGTAEQGGITPVRNLYNNYGAMLLGFIFEIVKNQKIAEQYLIEIFNDLPNGVDKYSGKKVSTLSELQILTRKKLSPFFESAKSSDSRQEAKNKSTFSKNKYIEQMTPEQQHVFCGVHYQGKNIPALAIELNRPEEEIRKILKESFTHIRKSNGYA